MWYLLVQLKFYQPANKHPHTENLIAVSSFSQLGTSTKMWLTLQQWNVGAKHWAASKKQEKIFARPPKTMIKSTECNPRSMWHSHSTRGTAFQKTQGTQHGYLIIYGTLNLFRCFMVISTHSLFVEEIHEHQPIYKIQVRPSCIHVKQLYGFPKVAYEGGFVRMR